MYLLILHSNLLVTPDKTTIIGVIIMEYETGKFKRDTTNRNGKPTNTVRVTGLSVNSIFKDNEDLIIFSKKDFTQLENQLKSNKETIQELETQVSTKDKTITDLKNEIENLKNTAPEPITSQKYYNELIQAKDEINNLNKTISNRNGLLLSTQDKLNEMLDNITTEFSTEISNANKEIVDQLKDKTDILKENITVLIDYVRDLENLQDNHNTKVDSSKWYKRAFSKDTFKLEIDTGKLKDLDSKLNEINQYCINYRDIIKPVEIPASRISEIKLNAKSNKFNIKELFIDTSDLDENDNITITPEAVNNGNDN